MARAVDPRQPGRGAAGRLAALLTFLALVACGPVPLAQAEAECLERARLAEAPRGTITFGVSTEGPYAGAEVSISSDYLQGKDPSQVYDQCVWQRAGQLPSRPYYSLPG